jgi:DHA2 family multidrug resistance protein
VPAGRSEPNAAAPLAPNQVNWLLLGLAAATGMEFYTFDSVNLVLPDIAGAIGVSADEASWILTVYSSSLFLGVPVSIWLAGTVGYKRYLIATILIYAAAAIGCALAPDLPAMLGWRAVQGFAGAGLVVWWRAGIYLLLPKPARSPALMRVSTGLYLSSALGLLLGGAIVDHLDWRLIFLPCPLYAAVAIWILWRHFPGGMRADPQHTRTDWPGIALIGIALIALQVILNRGNIDDWFGAPQIRLLGWTGAAALLLFVFWQTSPRNPAPLLRLELLRDRNVVSAALIGVFTGMILSGSLYVLPEFLRNVATESLSASQTGQVIAIYALTAALIRPLMVWVIARIGQRKTICLALLALAAAMLLFNRRLTADTPVSAFTLPLVLYAACLCALLPAVGSGTVAKIEQSKLLDGVSLYMTFRQFGAALGVALLAILIERRETHHAARLFDHLRDGAAETQSWLAAVAAKLLGDGGTSPGAAQATALKLLQEKGAQQAITLAYADAFLFMAGIGVLALCLVPVIPPSPAAVKK